MLVICGENYVFGFKAYGFMNMWKAHAGDLQELGKEQLEIFLDNIDNSH